MCLFEGAGPQALVVVLVECVVSPIQSRDQKARESSEEFIELKQKVLSRQESSCLETRSSPTVRVGWLLFFLRWQEVLPCVLRL